jgi:hypothetical protein
LLSQAEGELSSLKATVKDKPADDPDQQAVNDASAAHNNAVTTTDKTSAGVCGGGKPFQPCFYAGAFLASGSLAWFSVGNLHGGKTSHSLVSTVIPAIGIRLPLDSKSRFSLEAGVLSMLVSKDLTAATQRNGCRVSDGDFERRLPCDGNVTISPIVGLYAGATVGSQDAGFVTLMPMVGVATTSLDGSLRPYGGIAIGLVNLSKTINFLGAGQ